MRIVIVLLVSLLPLAAQSFELPPVVLEDGTSIPFTVRARKDFDPAVPTPVLVVLASADEPLGQENFEDLLSRGWLLVLADPGKLSGANLVAWGDAAVRSLQVRVTILGGRFHLFATEDRVTVAASLARRRRFAIGVVFLSAVNGRTLPAGVRKMFRPKRAHEPVLMVGTSGDALAESLAKHLPDRSGSAESTIHRVLDDFNDAAAKADEDRYFGRFLEKGVFLGTDATERWTLPEFKAFGMQYFQRDSAWIFVPLRRRIVMGPEGRVAWFDEDVGSASYGLCRGTGSVVRVAGDWRVAQYSLSIPMPNDVAGSFVARVREFEEGFTRPLTVYLVRTDGLDVPGATATGKALAILLRDVAVSRVKHEESMSAMATALAFAGVKKASRVVSILGPRDFAKSIPARSERRSVVVCGEDAEISRWLDAFLEKGRRQLPKTGTVLRFRIGTGDPDPTSLTLPSLR